MNLAAAVVLRKPIRKPTIPRAWAYGTSEGVTKSWDTRGRGRKFTLPNGRELNVSFDKAEQDKQLEQIRKEELAKLPQHVQDAFAKGVDTRGIFRDKDGNWDQARQEIHANIVAGFLQGHSPQANPHLEIVAGGTASGKSIASAEVKGRLGKDFVYVNTDNVRAMLPEIGAFVGNDKQGLLQEEAGYVRDLVLQNAADNKLNIILDAPGSHSVVNFAKSVEDTGYTVGVNYVHRDVDGATGSASDRKYVAEDLSDLRDVPTHVTFGSHAKARGAVDALQRGNREFRVYDNESRSGLVYHREASGNVKVYNGDRLGVIAHGQDKRLPELSDSTFRH